MREIDTCWEEAMLSGLDEWVKENAGLPENRVLGRVFEYLGYAALLERYPPPFILTGPGRTARIRWLISPVEKANWGVSIPDGIVLRREGSMFFSLVGIVDYKVANVRNLGKQRAQFAGFDQLIAFFRHQGGIRGRNILRRVLGEEIKRLEIPENVKFIYVVPRGRTVEGVATSLYGRDNLEEVSLSFTAQEVREKIEIFKRELKVKSGKRIQVT